MNKISTSHPRYLSLVIREQISEAMKHGIVHRTGLIAHGRGEAFDYLLGETTIPPADFAEKVAAATLLCARNPVISINGNVAVLAADDCISLSKSIAAKLEINLFHRTPPGAGVPGAGTEHHRLPRRDGGEPGLNLIERSVRKKGFLLLTSFLSLLRMVIAVKRFKGWERQLLRLI